MHSDKRSVHAQVTKRKLTKPSRIVYHGPHGSKQRSDHLVLEEGTVRTTRTAGLLGTCKDMERMSSAIETSVHRHTGPSAFDTAELSSAFFFSATFFSYFCNRRWYEAGRVNQCCRTRNMQVGRWKMNFAVPVFTWIALTSLWICRILKLAVTVLILPTFCPACLNLLAA
jgi:hypothetical protein